MRLLNIQSRQLSEFLGDSIPAYAALSHTWVTNEEISLQEFEETQKNLDLYTLKSHPHPSTLKSGYQKIIGCCEQALQDGLKWVWIDTCCIDKTSSAELSEAINSMFLWYRNCHICYTFLSDVSDVSNRNILSDQNSEFRRSRWFTRGWTLQELLAPLDMKFFSKTWNILGNRNDLCNIISQITRIPSKYLADNRMSSLFSASVAQRMSWASTRSTTRKEDSAYCLLGLFDVNMPLLYGEGHKAFRRLQEEIIKETNDNSIFAWGYGISGSQAVVTDRTNGPIDDPTDTQPYLAISPSDFAGCQDVICDTWSDRHTRSFEITKKGLLITIRLMFRYKLDRYNGHVSKYDILALLNCRPQGDLFNLIAIPLRRHKISGEDLLVTRDEEPAQLWVTRNGESAQLWPKRNSGHAVFKTVYITNYVSEPAPALDEHSDSLTSLEGSVIIPRMPSSSIELLSSDPTLVIESPEGMDHFVIREADLAAPTTASGAAYFRYQDTGIDTAFEPRDFLIMIAFQSSASISTCLNTNSHADHSSLEPLYPLGPNKLRKKRKYFVAAVERMKRIAERRNKCVAKKIGGRSYARRQDLGPQTPGYRELQDRVYGPIVYGKIHCFATKTPAVSMEKLIASEYLETLPWSKGWITFRGDPTITPRFKFGIQNQKVMGLNRGVITLTTRHNPTFKLPGDYYLIPILGSHRSSIAIQLFDGNKFRAFRLIIFFLLILGSAFGSSYSIAYNSLIAGGIYMVLAMNFVFFFLSKLRSGEKMWMKFYLFIGFIWAIAFKMSVFAGIIIIMPTLAGSFLIGISPNLSELYNVCI